MANVLTVSASYKSIVDTTSVVAGQTYVESALDQIIGARGSMLSGTYDENKCSIVSGTYILHQNYLNPLTSTGFLGNLTLNMGTEPIAADTIQVFYIKCDARRGRSDNRILVSLGSGSTSERVTVAGLSPGEGVVLFCDDLLSKLKTTAHFYWEDHDEMDATIALLAI